MWRKMKIWQILLLLFTLVWWAPAVFGEIRASFCLEHCSWNATHIIVVTEGEKIDGIFRVIESWKGNLKKSDSITIPELASFAAKDSRKIFIPFLILRKEDPNRSTHVTGSKMVLFLKKIKVSLKEGVEEKDDTTETVKELWMATSEWGGGMKESVAWIEEKKVYAFVQVINPGPSRLTSLGMSEAEMKTRVLEVLKTQNALAKAIALPDPVKRAEAIQPFASYDFFLTRQDAFDALGDCGESALPILLKILQNEDYDKFVLVRYYAAETLGKIGSKSAVKSLIKVLLKDPAVNVRWSVAEALGKIGDKSAVAPLMAALKDENEYVGAYAAQALKKITSQNFGQNYDKWLDWWEKNKDKIEKLGN